MIDISLIEKTDPELAEAMKKELYRQQNNIELIASENFVSPAVMAAVTLPTSMRKAPPRPAITAAVSTWTLPRIWRASV